MINHLMRTLQREHLLDWILVSIVAFICIPVCFAIGLSQPIGRELALNPIFNPALGAGFIILGLVIGFIRTAWKRGRYTDVNVVPRMGDVPLVVFLILKKADASLLFLIFGYVFFFGILSLVHTPIIIYELMMGSLVVVSMNMYRQTAPFVNPQGLSNLSTEQRKEILKLIDERKKNNFMK